MTFLSNVLRKVDSSPTLEISSKAKMLKSNGIPVVDLGTGEPDLPTPTYIIKATKNALDKGFTKYTAVDGIIELKNAICQKFLQENSLTYQNHDITVGCGAKQVIFNAMAATINEEDEILIQTPTWPSYIDISTIFKAKVVQIPTSLEENFCLNEEKLLRHINKKTKWLILNFPSNPTGAICNRQNLINIAQIIRENKQIRVITDDIYEHINFSSEKFCNILNVAPDLIDRILVVNGVSKAYCMTGYRIGYGAIKDPALIKGMQIIQSQSTSNPTSISQYAALEAIISTESTPFLRYLNDEMRAKMNIAFEGMKNINNLAPFKPQGAFYLFTSIEKLIGKKDKSGFIVRNGVDFCSRLLEKFNVAAVPGEAFKCANYFRISFATSAENISKGIEGIQKFVSELN